MLRHKNLHGCIRNQGWTWSRARVRIVRPVILSVVGAHSTTAPATLSIVSAVATQLVSPSVTRPARPEPLLTLLDKVFKDAKI